MSLDVGLYKQECIFNGNITHNLTEMALQAMLYYPIWRPEEIGVSTAGELIPFLKAGLKLLIDNKEEMVKLEPKNAWGDYKALLEFTEVYLGKCYLDKTATIGVCR